MVLADKEFTANNCFYGLWGIFFLFIFRQIGERFVIIGNSLHKVECAHHIAGIGEGDGGHVVFNGGVYQIHRAGSGLQNGKLRVVVKVNKGRIFEGGNVFLYLFGRNFLSFRSGLHLLSDSFRSFFEIDMLNPNQFNGLWIFFGKVFEIIWLHIKFFLRKNLTAHQFQKAASSCFNVGRSVVCFGERLVE